LDENICDISNVSDRWNAGNILRGVKIGFKVFCVSLKLIYTKFLAHGFGSVRDEWKELNNTFGFASKDNGDSGKRY